MTNPIPEKGFIPHLVVSGGPSALDFYRNAFGAEEIMRMPDPSGERIMHAEMRIGENAFYLSDDFPEFCEGKSRHPGSLGGTPVTIHMYVEDCDAVIDRAAKAGATVSMPPSDTFWGDRYGKVTDPFGHEWSVATHIKDMTPEEIGKAAAEFFG